MSADEPAPAASRPARGWAGQVGSADFSFAAAVGGVRGAVEATVPSLLFVLLLVVTDDLRTAVIGALAPAVAFTLVRLLQRQGATQAIFGLVGLGINAFAALRSGDGADFYVPGLLVNAAYLLAFVLSVLARYPAVGVLVGTLFGEGMTWRADPVQMRVYLRTTGIWIALFALRLAVQVPLYLHDQVGALGTARTVLGLPLYAVGAWLTWLMVAPVRRARQQADEAAGPPAED